MRNKYKFLVTARFTKEILQQLHKSIASVKYTGWGVSRQLLGEDQLIRELKDVDVFVSEYETISREVINSTERLKIIACCRNEPLASIDVRDATQKGIPVLYPPGRNAVSVAEYAFGLMLSISRNIHKVYHLIKYTTELTKISYRKGTKGRMNVPSEWSFDPAAPMNRFLGQELAGKVIGIVGLGAIGSQIAIRANAFGMKVITHDPYITDERVESFGAERIPLETLIEESDYTIISARVRDDNKGLISEALLNKMKPSAFFVNIARAHLVDYDALYMVLRDKKIAGAALDVYPSEPIPDDYPFIKLDNVILSPHLAGSTGDIERYHSRMIVDDLSLAFKGMRPVNLYNPDCWENSFFKNR